MSPITALAAFFQFPAALLEEFELSRCHGFADSLLGAIHLPGQPHGSEDAAEHVGWKIAAEVSPGGVDDVVVVIVVAGMSVFH